MFEGSDRPIAHTQATTTKPVNTYGQFDPGRLWLSEDTWIMWGRHSVVFLNLFFYTQEKYLKNRKLTFFKVV